MSTTNNIHYKTLIDDHIKKYDDNITPILNIVVFELDQHNQKIERLQTAITNLRQLMAWIVSAILGYHFILWFIWTLDNPLFGIAFLTSIMPLISVTVIIIIFDKISGR